MELGERLSSWFIRFCSFDPSRRIACHAFASSLVPDAEIFPMLRSQEIEKIELRGLIHDRLNGIAKPQHVIGNIPSQFFKQLFFICSASSSKVG